MMSAMASPSREFEPPSIPLLVDSIPALIHTARPDGYLDYFNKPWLEYLGVTLDKVTGWNWTAFIHPEDVDGIVARWRTCLATGETFEYETRVLRANGEYRWMFHRKVPLRDANGEIVKWYGSSLDIDERKTAEEQVRLNAQELQQFVDFVRHIITVLSPNGKITYANRVAREYTGLTIDEYRSVDVLARVIHPDDVEKMRAARERGLSANDPFELEARTLGKDGACRWFLYRYNPLRDERGQLTRWYVTGTDIEERKQAEMELRQMLDLAPQLIVVFGPGRERLYANRVALDYLGLTHDEWQHMKPDRGAFIHPDDRRIERDYADRSVSTGAAYDLELRCRKADGGYRWFLCRFNPVRDGQGQVMRWYVSCSDIDDRKRAEDRLRQENAALREEINKASMFEEIVGTSPALKTVLDHVSKVAPSDSTVLVTGETGTGKELVARAIHRRSPRASRPFVSVNCAAIPRDLIASELFGHEKGAFTGATQQRLGRFELANGGTIFLDEVGELPAETQIALLRVLQEREFERVGATRPIRADVRVIAATNRDLQAAVRAGSFRSDLFYRLHVFPIEIPPLRERSEDIPLLVEYFIDRYARKAAKNIRGVNKRTLQLLEFYPWPGNIRELQNVIERSVILCESEIFSIDESWLPQHSLGAIESEHTAELPDMLLAQEKNTIEAALKECHGRVYGPKGAAVRLGIPRSTLESKIRSLKINKNRFRI
jgi:PAS domain S-box-containing protein